jgi:LL-diaminopimelate aminotransferase
MSTQTTATPSNAPVDVSVQIGELWQNRDEYIMFRIARQVQELTAELTARGRAPLSLSMGAPTLPPPQGVMDVLTQSFTEPKIHQYSTTRGELFFREAVAKRMASRFGLNLDPKTEVMSLVGSKEGLANFFRGLITPRTTEAEKDVILVPDPGYASYVDSVHGAGGMSVPIPLTAANHYLPDMDEVWASLPAQGIDPKRVKAFIINYPSNPLGATAPLSYYEQMVAFARQHNLVLVSDNAYADMYFNDQAKPHSILEVPGAKDVAIEFHSLSKPYCLTGWRIGFAIGPKVLIDLLALVKGTMDSGLFKGIQKAGAYALNSEEGQAHIHTVNQVYAENQKQFMAGLATLGWPVDTMLSPVATFYLWMPIPPRYASCVQFSQELLTKSGIVTVPGTGFGQYGEGFVRLSLVLSQADHQAVIDRMRTDGFTWQ